VKRREFITLLGGATTRCAACAEAVYSSERLRTTDFGGSGGTASTVVRVPASGVPRLSKPLLRAVYCVGGGDGAFARKISATLLLPEQAASRAAKIDTAIMRIMTIGVASLLLPKRERSHEIQQS
jgi:hypothetical protein